MTRTAGELKLSAQAAGREHNNMDSIGLEHFKEGRQK
jgi:hypothetical protein